MATATLIQTQTQSKTHIHTGPIFVTLAYAWGFQDGAIGADLAVSDLYTHSDPRWVEFTQGYIAGAQHKGYMQAALVAASLLR
jgi:hypothetical protein